MLKNRIHLIPPAVTEIADGAMNDSHANARENYTQRLRAIGEYVTEALIRIEQKVKSRAPTR